MISPPPPSSPAVVWAGRDYGPALVVVDPSGAAKPGELPATWRSLAEEHQIAWCRVPAGDPLPTDVEDVLETLAQQQTRVDLVAAGLVCDAAVRLGAEFAASVRSVLLVDPGPVTAGGVRTRVVARSAGRESVEPPLPLGHPVVVDGVRAALLDVEREIAERPQ